MSQDWRDSNKNLKDKICYMYDTCSYTDVILSVDNGAEIKEFKAHELILRLSSKIFETSLNGCFKESSTKVIEIFGIEPDIFEIFLRYLYCDTVQLDTVEESIELYKVAHRYMCLPLKEICLEHIKDNISTTTACTGLEFADFYMLDDLKSDCLLTIQEATESVMSDINFLNANIDTVSLILNQDTLTIREIDLFNAIEKWIKNKSENMKDELCQKIIPKICYFNMTPQEFTDGPVVSGLLKETQWPFILANLASDKCPLPLPDGFQRNYRCVTTEPFKTPYRLEQKFYKSYHGHQKHTLFKKGNEYPNNEKNVRCKFII